MEESKKNKKDSEWYKKQLKQLKEKIESRCQATDPKASEVCRCCAALGIIVSLACYIQCKEKQEKCEEYEKNKFITTPFFKSIAYQNINNLTIARIYDKAIAILSNAKNEENIKGYKFNSYQTIFTEYYKPNLIPPNFDSSQAKAALYQGIFGDFYIKDEEVKDA